MKKLILFFISVFLINTCYSQYKIRINWNRPKPQSVSKVEPKKQPVIENRVVDSSAKMVIIQPEAPKKEISETEYKLKNFINSWMGVKYVFGGDSRKGIDCSAFVRRLYKSVYDVSLPRTCIYQYQIVKKVKKECLELGDLIFFRTKRGSGWHVGVFLGDDKFVHASGKGRNVMISDLNNSFYKRIYLNGGRL
jgi:cell wall-associated NlpC family hydrolase